MQTAVGYVRCSTEEQALSGLGLDAQRHAIAEGAARFGFEVVELFTDAGVSARAPRRPALDAAVVALETPGGPRAMIVARVDRLARSTVAYGRLLGRGLDNGWEVIALDAPDRTDAGRFLRDMLAAAASYEGALISSRTKVALAMARARGVQLGRRSAVTPAMAARILELRERGYSALQIASRLDIEQPWPLGGRWRHQTVSRVLRAHGVELRRGRPPLVRVGALRRLPQSSQSRR